MRTDSSEPTNHKRLDDNWSESIFLLGSSFDGCWLTQAKGQKQPINTLKTNKK
jgi:hypothetical protein